MAATHRFFEPFDEPSVWSVDANNWMEHDEHFAESECFPEADSTKQREDCVELGERDDMETLLATFYPSQRHDHGLGGTGRRLRHRDHGDDDRQLMACARSGEEPQAATSSRAAGPSFLLLVATGGARICPSCDLRRSVPSPQRRQAVSSNNGNIITIRAPGTR